MITPMNPATGVALPSHADLDNAALRSALKASGAAFTQWRRTTYEQRAALLRVAARLLKERRDRYARLMADEMGKPLAQGRAEADKCAWVCEYYAEHGAGFLADEIVQTDFSRSLVTYQPIGVVLAIMPWNFPFWQVIRVAAPTLMAGNVVALKHAANVPGCALAIEELFRDAGFPAGAFTTLLIDTVQVRAAIRHPAVQAVSLTGSVGAGRAVARLAGERIKKTVLELGGSDAYVILKDADLQLAADTCANSRLINSGQSCIAAKRFIVVDSVREEFERLLVERMRAARVGSPLEDGVTVGPLARHDLRDTLHDQVQRSVAAGARLLLGGTIPPGAGAYYTPTVLTDVKKGMAAYSEELFGPVAAIIPVKNEKAAIKAANDSTFGLGAAVFTRDTARGERIAREEIQAGSCFVNALVKSDPRLPFGGIKESGYGRELSHHGIREFVNAKVVSVL
jgi:succinate-semialdehyde dehydrogenase/glutarate-semialdehyde dehydrogenase